METSVPTMTFAEICEFLGIGSVVRRASNNEYVIFLQIPQSIKEDIVPKMTSLSQQAKDFIMSTNGHIDYHDQCIKYNINTGAATYFIPTIEDINAIDWIVVSA